jgi:methylated-DNA-[protein]-cysteine S-methyltransferase
MSTPRYLRLATPLGAMLLVATGRALSGAYFVGQKHDLAPQPDWVEDDAHAVLRDARRQLLEYFAAQRAAFDLPLAPTGSEFQRKVWRALLEIPCGHTATYGEIAARIEARSAMRAVGAAIGRNPISIVVPCHRVIGADGALTGYAGGLDRKRRLLALEAGQARLFQPAAALAG